MPVGLPRGVPRSQPLGTSRFQKQKLLENLIFEFLFPLCPGATWPGRRSRYKMHLDSDNAACSSRADQSGSSSKELNPASLLASFGLYIYLLPAQRLHFPPRSSRINDCASSERDARDMSRKVVRSSSRRRLSVLVRAAAVCLGNAVP